MSNSQYQTTLLQVNSIHQFKSYFYIQCNNKITPDIINQRYRLFVEDFKRALLVFPFIDSNNRLCILVDSQQSPHHEWINKVALSGQLALQQWNDTSLAQLKKSKWHLIAQPAFLDLTIALMQQNLLSSCHFNLNWKQLNEIITKLDINLSVTLDTIYQPDVTCENNSLVVGNYQFMQTYDELLTSKQCSGYIINLQDMVCHIGICKSCTCKLKNNEVKTTCLTPLLPFNTLDYTFKIK